MASHSACFFQLPREIRDLIYQYALRGDTAYHQFPPSCRRIQRSTSGLTVTPLLLACKALSTEALPIFYSQNRFILTTGLEYDNEYSIHATQSIHDTRPRTSTGRLSPPQHPTISRLRLLEPKLRRSIRALAIEITSDGYSIDWKALVRVIQDELNVKSIQLSLILIEPDPQVLKRLCDLLEPFGPVSNLVTDVRVQCELLHWTYGFWKWCSNMVKLRLWGSWSGFCRHLAKKLPNVRELQISAREEDLVIDESQVNESHGLTTRKDSEEQSLNPFILELKIKGMARCICWTRPASFGVSIVPISETDYHAWTRGGLDVSEGSHSQDTIRQEIILNPPESCLQLSEELGVAQQGLTFGFSFPK